MVKLFFFLYFYVRSDFFLYLFITHNFAVSYALVELCSICDFVALPPSTYSSSSFFSFLRFFNVSSSAISFLIRSLFMYTDSFMMLFPSFFASFSTAFLFSLVLNLITTCLFSFALFRLLYTLLIISSGLSLPIFVIKSLILVQSFASFSLVFVSSSLFVPSSSPFITTLFSFTSLF